MNEDEFNKLMNDLKIPKENIVTIHEPSHSLEILLGLENKYHINTSSVVNSDYKKLLIDKDTYLYWNNVFEDFEEYNGNLDLLDNI